MAYWGVHLLNGLSFGSLLFLLSSGFTLAFGVMKVINIAHGSLYMLGAYIALSVGRWSGSFPLAVASGAVAVMALGCLAEEFLLKRFHLKDLSQILLTMGLAFINAEVSLILWGGHPMVMPSPGWLEGPAEIGPIYYPKYRLFVIAVSATVAVVLWLVQERSRVGAFIRACVDDEEMASAMKINTRRLFVLMFGFSALLAGFGGAIGAPYIGAYPGLDFEILPLALVVTIIGGLGSLAGAVLGSLFVGLIDAFGKAMFPELSYFTLFAPMILVLALKPTGLFGREPSR
ncbi:MAG: branched-chain amino acid ABC transporter permease [Alphaproteobacteria bacterium]